MPALLALSFSVVNEVTAPGWVTIRESDQGLAGPFFSLPSMRRL